MPAAWTVKHKPRSLGEIVGNKQPIMRFVDWVKSWERGVPSKRALFLFGPPGVGKTLVVEALASELHMELVEKNASDYRTKEAVGRFAGLASKYGSLFSGRRIVLLDEVDGLTGNADRGGVRAITEIVKTAQFPVVLTANDAYQPRFSNLRRYCLLIEFRRVSAGDVLKHLKRICVAEGIEAEEEALNFISQRSEGDVRSAVNDLQALAEGKRRLTYDDVSWLGHRDRQQKIFTVLKMIMYGKTCVGAKRAVDMADVDIDMLFEWIYENVPAHLSEPRDLAGAMEALSLADLYRSRIRSTQNWGLMRYVIDYMTSGVAMARQNTKTGGWIPFKFPERIKLLSRTRGQRELRFRMGEKIKRKCHISSRRASKEFIPYLRIIFRNDAETAARLARWFNLDPAMVEFLAGSKKKTENVLKLLS